MVPVASMDRAVLCRGWGGVGWGGVGWGGVGWGGVGWRGVRMVTNMSFAMRSDPDIQGLLQDLLDKKSYGDLKRAWMLYHHLGPYRPWMMVLT